MGDVSPPSPPSGPDSEDEAKEAVVKDGYYRYTDIAFEWAKGLDDNQAAAVRAMVHREVLIQPDHPLHQGDEEGITLYMGHLADGKRRLLFSLKQVEYMRYYIHELRLADASYVEYLEKVKAATDTLEIKEPPLVEEKNPWVRMPDGITLPGEYETIEEIVLATGAEIKKCVADVSKGNKRVGKPSLPKMVAPVVEVIEDNRPFYVPPVETSDEPDQTSAEPAADGGWGELTILGYELVLMEGEEDRADLSAPGLPYDPVPEELDEEGEKFVQKISEINAYAAEMGLPQIDVPVPINPNSPEQYFYHAQQAVLLASAGGLAVAQSVNPEPGQAVARPEIGRSLFVALSLKTWEEDEMTVLEAGWAGAWWQEKLTPASSELASNGECKGKEEGDKDETKTISDFSEEDEACEMMTSQGHFIVQEHMLDKNNGNKVEYQHGQTLPVGARELPKAITQALKDMSSRAGGGPVYILIHSPNGDQTEFRKIGWKVSGWEKAIHPKGWEYPSYSSEEGIGKVFLIDTAILFGAIEEPSSIAPALGKTRKSLEEVGGMMFGEDKGFKGGMGNAGNAAYVFLNLAQGPGLETLKAEFAKAQSPGAQAPGREGGATATASQDDAQTTAKDVPSPVNSLYAEVVDSTPGSPAVEATKAKGKEVVDDEGSDLELEQVQAVYYTDAEGDVVRIEDDEE